MNKSGNHKHLTLSDRVFIEQGLLQECSFKSMADMLYKDPTTISKEIRLHAETSIFCSNRTCNWCKFFSDCDIKAMNSTAPNLSSGTVQLFAKNVSAMILPSTASSLFLLHAAEQKNLHMSVIPAKFRRNVL